ncbi:hypothetical protein [Glaciihabitans sp. dw_435]|uniref:hypothetical protein n=1 Tax=Glaciihabitans sp. dw_435 TaxID=2720081 RepID=UPI001BD254B2|nr:hypothetical protein [Glaciihabitans sp. dw_435]
MSNHDGSAQVPGDGYEDTNERDIHSKQTQDVSDSEAFADGSIDPAEVKVLPGTGGPDDVGDEEVPADYDPTGHAREGGR